MRVLTFFAVVGTAFAADAPADFFEMRVRPVLAKNCYSCHTNSALGGLRLDSREAMVQGGKSGPAIVPGDAAQSLLVQAVSQTHERLKMPPAAKLADREIDDLKNWIVGGAIWPQSPVAPAKSGYTITPEQRAFWSFQPVKKPSPGASIDGIILAALAAKNLKQVARADKRTLIRRATLDLTGLPPAPEDVDAFLADRSPNAFAKVVDRLLASPRYGERWGRYWLDVARYSDDRLNSTQDSPYENSFRYRDWVIGALNSDMPYDQFVKAQIAGDLMPEREKYEAGLGFYSLSPEFQDDRVDATARGFLGLTVACAQCHDHKFDPIPQKDYYSLLGVFRGTKLDETPLATAAEVEAWKKQKKLIDDQEAAIQKFVKAQASQLAEILAGKTVQYLEAAAGGSREGLDGETVERWVKYLAKTPREHPFLPAKGNEEFQTLALAVSAEKKDIDDQNYITLGGSTARSDLSSANLKSLERDRYFLWRDLFGDNGVYYYGGEKIDRFLEGEWKAHLAGMRSRLAELKKALPVQYPFLHTIHDVEKPGNMQVFVRGNPQTPGEEAPRRFLQVLCDGEPPLFKQGSGRLELADAIASKSNPLTARVMVNRIWLGHFGQAIVRTPSSFGQLGERPSHPEMLDYLASRFMEGGWSMKALHREIMLSRTYALSAANSSANFTADPENRLLWRANRRRLDVESLRDSILFAAGTIDTAMGGMALPLNNENRRRTVYGFVSRRKLDGMLALFDFPNPNNTSEQRLTTNVPLQRLFFMNSGFVEERAKAFAERLAGSDSERIKQAYRILYGRVPDGEETRLGLTFVANQPDAWPRYAQALLGSNEFTFIE